MTTTRAELDILAVDPREAKLPAWAQTKLANARRRVQDAGRDAAEAALQTDPDGSDAVLNQHGLVGRPIGLGSGYRAEVAFRVNGIHRDSFIRVRRTADGAGILLNGDDQLLILPQVTNVVEVRFAPRDLLSRSSR